MKDSRAIYRWSVVVLVHLATYGSAMAHTTCFSTYTSGSGDNFMKVCISRHGNLVQFESPAGSEHLRVDTIGEGYRICGDSGGVTQFGHDAGFHESGFGAPTITQPNGANTFPLTITRTTTDDKFQLRQTFNRDTREKDVTITMTLTNLSPAPISTVSLTRYFDGDIDNDIDDDRYARTGNSVWGYEDVQAPFGEGHGLMLTPLTFSTPHSAVVRTFNAWSSTLDNCGDVIVEPTPTDFGNFVGEISYFLGTMQAGQSKTVKFLYKRF